jgi:hypothetical protein
LKAEIDEEAAEESLKITEVDLSGLRKEAASLT